MATMRSFNVLGNPQRLMQVAHGPQQIPPEGIPQGVILIWREGYLPFYEMTGGAWTVSMAFCILPPFAQVVSETSSGFETPALRSAGAAPPGPHQHGNHSH